MLVAWHGDAGYAVDGALSDDGGALTDKGRDQVRQLVEQVRSRRVTAVYSSQMGRAVESAELAAAQLGLRSLVVDGLQEFSVGELAGVSYQDLRAHQVFDAWLQGDLDAGYPGAEHGRAVIERFKEALEAIADTHRGETVLVFTHSGVMSLAVPRLSFNVRNDLVVQRFLPNCVAVEIEVDADGWRVVTWPGATDEAKEQVTS